MTHFYNSSELVNHTENSSDLHSQLFNKDLNIFNQHHKDTWLYTILCVIGLIFATGILLLNGTVIKALVLSKHSPDVSHVVVASLSLADLLTGLVLIYITLHSFIGFQNFTECLIRIGLIYTVSLSSYIHLLAITIDRYIKIVHPFYYFRIFTQTKVTIMSLIIWICSGFIGFLPLLGWHKTAVSFPGTQDDKKCLFFGVITNGYFKLNFAINVCVIALTALLYGCILYVARKQHNAIVIHQSGSLLIDKHAWKLAKTVFLVVVMSNLLWLPGVILIILHMSGGLNDISMDTRGELIAYSGAFAFLNCLTNPLIYAAKITSVRNVFHTIFCCWKRDRQNSSVTQEELYEMEKNQLYPAVQL